MVHVLLDEFNVITSYSIKLSDNQVFTEEWVSIDTDIDLDLLIFNYKYIDGELIELAEEEKQRYLNTIRPITLEEQVEILQEENKNLKTEQEQQNEEILVNMLANTEMFEMILGMMPMTLSKDKTKNNGGNSMIEVYVTLIIKGVKTIEDVPLVIREQVIERLRQLEVPVK